MLRGAGVDVVGDTNAAPVALEMAVAHQPTLDFVAPGAWSLTSVGPAGGAELCVDLPRGA